MVSQWLVYTSWTVRDCQYSDWNVQTHKVASTKNGSRRDPENLGVLKKPSTLNVLSFSDWEAESSGNVLAEN